MTPTSIPTRPPDSTVEPVVTKVNEVEDPPTVADEPSEVETSGEDGSTAEVNAPANALPAGVTLKASAVGNVAELTVQAPPSADVDVVLAFVIEATDSEGTALTEDFAEPIAVEFNVPAISVPAGATSETLVLRRTRRPRPGGPLTLTGASRS